MTDTHTHNNNFFLWAAVVLAMLPLFLVRPGIQVGDTVTSRMATVYALAHDGTWYIDRPSHQPPNPFEIETVDKVMTRHGRLISSKPPLLPLLMTAEYVVMRRVFGWDLENPDDMRPIMRAMNATLIKIPHAVALIFFALLLRMFMPDARRAALILLLFAFATPMLGYSLQFNNHTPAAAALTVALYFGLGIYCKKMPPAPWRFAVFGLSSAFVFTMDMPVTIFPAVMGALLLLRHPKQSILWAGLGAAPLLLLHFGVMAYMTGNPLPVQTREEMYNFRNSYWRNPIGVDGLNENWLVYLFHLSFGRFGTFLLFPVLLLGIAGFWVGLTGAYRDAGVPLVAAAAAFVVMTAYYVVATNNYGGAAYGFRWHIGAVPVLMLMAVPAVASAKRPWHWAVIGLMAAVSLFSAWECLQAPWGASHEWTCRWLFGPVY